jgi:hypothetical protein
VQQVVYFGITDNDHFYLMGIFSGLQSGREKEN